MNLAFAVLIVWGAAFAPRTTRVEPFAIAANSTAQHARDEHAFLEVDAARDTYFVGEPIHVRLRFGVETEFARASLVQLFRQPLDVPVQIEAHWIGAIANVTFRAPVGSANSLARQASFALAERPAFARRLEDRVEAGHIAAGQIAAGHIAAGQFAAGQIERERRFTVLEYETVFCADVRGDVTIPATILRYAYATRFDDDFAKGRVALDRHDASVESAPFIVHVQALPEANRPHEFGGAVGTFSIAAELASRDVDVGQSLALAVHIEGDGNLASFEPPRADLLEGFHVRGVLDDHDGARRTITYDLTPDDEHVDKVPALRFAYFDPNPPAQYRTIATMALAIRVHAAPTHTATNATDSNTAAESMLRGVDSRASTPSNAAEDMRASGADANPRPMLFFVGTVLAIGIAIAIFVRAIFVVRAQRARRRGLGGDAATKLRVRLAHSRTDTSTSDTSTTEADVADAFGEYLAARLTCPPSAVIGRDLVKRLQDAQVPTELTSRTAKLLEALVAARFGGPRVAHADDEVQRLVVELERAFQSMAKRS